MFGVLFSGVIDYLVFETLKSDFFNKFCLDVLQLTFLLSFYLEDSID
jgi:hypothetical protein